MKIDSPYPDLTLGLYKVFKDFAKSRPLNHILLYETLFLFVNGIIHITYDKGVPEITKEQKKLFSDELKVQFGSLMDLAFEEKL